MVGLSYGKLGACENQRAIAIMMTVPPSATINIDAHLKETRAYLGNLHLVSAVRLARLATIAEKSVDEVELRACVSGSVFLSIAFVEAAINEVFCDAADAYWQRELGKFRLHKKLAAAWRDGSAANGTTLQKYQTALLLAEKETFDAGSEPYQSMESAIRLRNHLIHYEPQIRTLVPEPVKLPKLEQRLRGKFATNTRAGYDAFPHAYFSAACADWVIRISWSFVDDFFRRLGRYASKHPCYRSELFRNALESL